ncbi:signal transduction histidine kinase [Alkalibacillus flavidus]|uniref:Signal transduction histidine kinase n=1 Tax=Alkalibacillus flavidus TaxID=546021 RepID=A0ABV2KWY5_9BACI
MKQLNLLHISSRIATAFLTMLLTAIAYLAFTEFNLPEVYNLLSNPYVWLIFIIYLVICSYINEWLAKKLNDSSRRMFVSLYMMSAMVIWFIVYIPLVSASFAAYLYIVLYSSLFTVMAFLLFYFIEQFVRRSKQRPAWIGIPAIAILVIALIWNPTIKSGYSVASNSEQLDVHFDQLNGLETIHIPVEADEQYEIRVKWDLMHDRPHGLERHPGTSDYGDLSYVGDDDWLYEFNATASGDVPFTFYGHNIEGTITFTWKNVSEG